MILKMRQLVDMNDPGDDALVGPVGSRPQDPPGMPASAPANVKRDRAWPAFILASVRQNFVFWIGVAVLVLPTLISIARHGWATEQGAHAPIVLATGTWLIALLSPAARAVAQPGRPFVTLIWLVPSLLVYAAAKISGLTEVEALGAYAALVAILYSNTGIRTLKVLWYPLVYGLFLIPPPDSLIDSITQPIKIGTSDLVVWSLAKVGYPIASSGVSIFIGQYELLVAAACSGLNSLISLTAIGSFYVYISHKANWRYMALLMIAVVPIAILANFIRVVILVLLTYHAGEAAAQGFLHQFAGLFMFTVALLTIFGIDKVASPLRRALETKAAAA